MELLRSLFAIEVQELQAVLCSGSANAVFKGLVEMGIPSYTFGRVWGTKVNFSMLLTNTIAYARDHLGRGAIQGVQQLQSLSGLRSGQLNPASVRGFSACFIAKWGQCMGPLFEAVAQEVASAANFPSGSKDGWKSVVELARPRFWALLTHLEGEGLLCECRRGLHAFATLERPLKGYYDPLCAFVELNGATEPRGPAPEISLSEGSLITRWEL